MLQALRGGVLDGADDFPNDLPDDCLAELAVDPDRPLAPYLMQAEEAWGLAQRMGLASCSRLAASHGSVDAFLLEQPRALLLQAGWVADPLAAGPLASVANAYRAAFATRRGFDSPADGPSIPVQAHEA